MTAKELYDYILLQMTAEEALMKLLSGPLIEYEKLKFSEEGAEIHPLLLVMMAAQDMGWMIAIEDGKDDEHVQGVCIGTEEYMKKIFPKE